MWGPSRAKKGLDLCPEQGKDLSLSHLLAADLSRSFPIRRAFFGLLSARSISRISSTRYVTQRSETRGQATNCYNRGGGGGGGL